MSEVFKDQIRFFVRYVKFDDDGTPLNEMWLCADEDHTYDPPKRDWRLSKSPRRAHDFQRSHGEKAQTYAMSLGKIVKVGKQKLANGWKLEIVFVRDVTRRTMTVVTDNPMAVIALAALD
jgi:hypothetical protein